MSFTRWNLKTKTKRFFIPSWEQSTNPIQQDQVRSHEACFLRLFWATFYDYKKEKVITFSLSLFFFRMLAAQVLWLIPMFGHWRMLKKKISIQQPYKDFISISFFNYLTRKRLLFFFYCFIRSIFAFDEKVMNEKKVNFILSS